ncbi:hypothetical protein V8C42DRAFT_320032 [Trichoderma barbatum]
MAQYSSAFCARTTVFASALLCSTLLVLLRPKLHNSTTPSLFFGLLSLYYVLRALSQEPCPTPITAVSDSIHTERVSQSGTSCL